MDIKAVIFDKDGTLIDFDAFWVTVSVKAMEDILRSLGREDISIEEFLTAFGVQDGVTDINGVLCKGTYEQMGRIVHTILRDHGCTLSGEETVRLVVDAYNRNADAGEVKPTCPDLAEVLAGLKKQNIKLAVVTTDNEPITRQCLRKLGIDGLFDKIYTDDGTLPVKPDPGCARDFCRVIGVEPEQVAMVGDTLTDVQFAKNAGLLMIGVAKTQGNRAILSPHADAVIPAISQLPGMLR